MHSADRSEGLAKFNFLTKELVDSAVAPENGELWISDSEVRGLGLRIWSSNGRQGKAYCVRTKDARGRFIRRTLKWWELPRSYWRWVFYDEDDDRVPTLGDHVHHAREWARDEIDRLKGRPTLDQEERSQRARSAWQGRHITLARAAKAVLLNLQLGGRSLAYRDRLDKLFALYVPEPVKSKRLTRLTEEDLATVLRNPHLSYGNMRTLRPFLGKCVNITEQVKLRRHRSLWDFERNLEIEVTKIVNPMVDWEVDSFRNLISHLTTHAHWRQALCLALYFETREALESAMAAEWDQFKDVPYRSQLDAEEGRFWRREWQLHGKGGWRHQITVRANRIFELVAHKRSTLAEASPYLFPSGYGRQFPHIRSVDHVWRDVIATCSVPYISPRMARILYSAALWGSAWSADDGLFSPVRE